MSTASSQSAPQAKAKPRRRLAWVGLILLILATVAIVLIPIWLIQPFAPQSARDLSVSYSLRQWSPAATLVASALALGLMAYLWRGARWWRKALLVVALLPILGMTWLARQNHFEWMFRPLPSAQSVPAAEAGFVAETDMVLGVKINGEAVAYPVRQIAYHHVVQDVVGGQPIVVTY